MSIYYKVLQFLRGRVKPKYNNITIVFGLQIEGKVRKVLQKSKFFEMLKIFFFLKLRSLIKNVIVYIVMILRKLLSWEGCYHFVAKYYSITSFEGGSGVWPKKYYVIFAQSLNVF